MVVLITKQVLFQLQPKGIILTIMMVIELHFVVVLTLQSGGYTTPRWDYTYSRSGYFNHCFVISTKV